MKQIKFVIFIALSLCSLAHLNAQSKVWNGSTSADWSTASNWTPAIVPIAGDSVIIPNQTNQPNLTTTTPDLMHVEINAGATLTLSGTSKLNIDGTPSNSQLLGIRITGNLILSGLSDTINVRNTTSDGLLFRSGSSSLTNNGVIITDQTTFSGIHFGSGTTFVNSGEFWILNDDLFLDGTVTFVNNGLIDVSDHNVGISFRNTNTSINQLQNFGEIRLKNTLTSLSRSGTNISGDFINEQCGILTVSNSFGAGLNAITNNGLINYTATANNHNGTYTDNGFQYDPNGQLPDGSSNVLSSPLNQMQFNYNLDGDGTSLCQGDFPDDLPAANDVCATAIDYESAFGLISNTIDCGGTSLDFTAYADGGFDPNCDFGDDATAWYTWTATDSILNFLSATGAPGLEVLEGSCGSLSSLGCLNNVTGTISGLTIGNPYYLLIWDDGLGAADVDWSLTTGMITSYDMTPTCGDTLDYPVCDFQYPNNDNQTFTICPLLDADTASITFTHFDLETCCDFVTIFDDGVQIAQGNGTAFLGSTFSAADTSHCLEVVFTSDGSVTGTGFTFVVNCAISNDTCGGAYPYESVFGPIGAEGSCPSNMVSLDMSNYTAAGRITDGAPTCDGTNDAAAWYTWTATSTAIRFTSGQGDPGLEILEGSCGSFTSFGCINNVNNSVGGLTIGQSYYIVIWDDGTPGASEVTWCIEEFTPLVNDLCTGALDYTAVFGPIGAPGSCPSNTDSLDMTGYTDAGRATDGAPTCDGTNDAAAWYTWTATSTAIRFTSGLGAPGLEILEGSCGSFTSLGCFNNENGSVGGLTIGQSYQIVIWDNGIPGASEVTWCIEEAESAINDSCTNAIPISCGAIVIDSTIFASANDAPTPCGTDTDATFGVWYSFIGTGDTMIVSTDNVGTNFDTELQIFSGSCGALTCVDGADDNGPNFGGEVVRFLSIIGETYFIYVDGHSNRKGTFELSLSCVLPPCVLLVSNTDDSGFGSLRDAVDCAMSGDTIRFDASIDDDSIKLTSGQINIDKDLTILGNGRANTIIDGSLDDASRLFQCNTGHAIEFRGLTMQHGGGAAFAAADQFGGAIVNFSQLKLIDCHLQNNIAKNGGAIESAFSANRLVILNCEISDNHATNQSGAINMFDGEGVMLNSLVHGNHSAIAAGGIIIFGTAQFKFIGNTITNNSSPANSGVRIDGAGTNADFYNCIISGNSGALPDLLLNVGGTINNFQNNILGSTVGNSLASGFILGYPAFVDTANNNYQLLAHSIGIDGGDNAFIPVDSCDVDGDGNTTELLPIDLAGNVRSLRCNVDIGAYEFGVATFCPAVNDLCTGAFELGCDTTFLVDPSLATDEGQPGTGACVFPLNGLWYRFIGTGDSVLISASGDGPGIQVFRGACDSLSCLAGNFTYGSNLDVGFQSVLGEDYLIYIDGGDDVVITATLSCILDCPATRTVAGTPDAGSYFAQNSINSDATIENPKGVLYQAGDEILLNQGFEVELGAEFDAVIGPCP